LRRILPEEGAASVEFVIVFPFFLGVFLSGYEVAMMNMRAVMMERAMDVVVRNIRLSSGATLDYDQVKNDICSQAFMIPDCSNTLKVELLAINTTSWNGLQNRPDCVDRRQTIQPIVQFQNGQQNELMLMRICAVVDPVFPGIGVGRSMPKDPSGGYQIIATSAFVNEPQ
jgi:Flp pilus assembly protein TadG